VLFSEFVVDLAAQRFRFEKKHTALASTRRAYRAREHAAQRLQVVA
jgi:hypothetical protein